MAVVYRSSTHGVLQYIPLDASADALEKPSPLYRPRRPICGRVIIKTLLNGSDLAPVASKVSSPLFVKPAQYHPVQEKLAAARENAKRLLRSVIPTPTSTDTNQNTHSDASANSAVLPISTPVSAPTVEHGQSSLLPNRRSSFLASKRFSWSPLSRNQLSQLEEAIRTNQPPPPEHTDMRAGIRSSISGPVNQHLLRPRIHVDARGGSNGPPQSDASSPMAPLRVESTTFDRVIPNLDLLDEKPIASGNGVSIAVHLAEPVLFLQGFENSDHAHGNTAMLRGSLHLRVQKSAKIKAVTLKFKGRAITKWPEGIPPRKTEFEEVDTIMSHTWPFFNAQFESAENGTNADHVHLFHKDGPTTSVTRIDPLGRASPNVSTTNLSPRDAKRLSLQVNQSRSFGKSDPPAGGPTVSAKGYRTFLPGDYIYSFELPLDSRLPETIDVELGNVKYELEASVERSGAFRANLAGTKEVTLIRAPSEGSLEQVEPIAISRNWEDQLHYDIVISGKSFPLGSKVPIAFKLTPLAKVQCHRIKVLVTENIEYFCSNKRVHRMEPTRKVQLFEKRADRPPTSAFSGSTMAITSGGGIPYDQRARAAAGEDIAPLDSTNLLGPLNDPDNHSIGPTEMEFSVQLPSCEHMKEKERSTKLHFDTTYQNIQVHHWIKIVMRLSKPDANDPSKRRHFEISIDSPFHILSCRATQANISLPAYSSPPHVQQNASLYECGCPGAARKRNSPTSFVPTLNALNSTRTGEGNEEPVSGIQPPTLTRPQLAHVHGQGPRPMHLLRAPSFNPPAFEDEAPPPALITPPPQYNDIASPTSGLADYFSRLSDAYDSDESDENHRAGRVNIPLTPGGRINRSMDLGRRGLPVARESIPI